MCIRSLEQKVLLPSKYLFYQKQKFKYDQQYLFLGEICKKCFSFLDDLLQKSYHKTLLQAGLEALLLLSGQEIDQLYKLWIGLI